MALRFTQKAKEDHYTKVAKGVKATKKGSKFTKKEQMAYARGQMDARNEAKRNWAYKNATPQERKAYRDKKRAEREAYKKGKDSK